MFAPLFLQQSSSNTLAHIIHAQIEFSDEDERYREKHTTKTTTFQPEIVEKHKHTHTHAVRYALFTHTRTQVNERYSDRLLAHCYLLN